jgi:hypothetical protein
VKLRGIAIKERPAEDLISLLLHLRRDHPELLSVVNGEHSPFVTPVYAVNALTPKAGNALAEALYWAIPCLDREMLYKRRSHTNSRVRRICVVAEYCCDIGEQGFRRLVKKAIFRDLARVP